MAVPREILERASTLITDLISSHGGAVAFQELQTMMKEHAFKFEGDVWALVRSPIRLSCHDCGKMISQGDAVWRDVRIGDKYIHNYDPCKGKIKTNAAEAIASLLAQKFSDDTDNEQENYEAALAVARLGGLSSMSAFIDDAQKK